MAAGFKQATVNASRVPSTQSNFPVYVDLSRLGITTLAEAQSVRVYADSGKTTEWAREIVSATEMHVKVPSMTSTTSIYVDYDGVRADYAATDTYGRNAVWSDYVAVFHLEDTSSPLINSTGGDTLTSTGSPTYSATGKIEDGISTPGGSTASYFANDSGVTGATTAPPISLQCWGYPTSGGNFGGGNSAVYVGGGTSNHEQGIQFFSGGISAVTQGSAADSQARGSSITANTWYMAHAVFSSTSNRKYYQNGSLAATNTASNTCNAGSKIRIASRYTTSSQNFQGSLDEVRVRNSELSANWITTEYNNQNNESDFWGTWSDAGGAPARGAILAYF